MKKTLKFSTLAILFFLATSCASIFTKTTYPVSFNTTPPNAKLEITDKKGYEVFVGQTPVTVPLKSSSGFFSKAEYQVKITLPGYHEYVSTISADIEGWYFGNILLGGVIGMLIIDPATGAMWTIKTEIVSIELKPENQSLHVYSIDQIPDNLRDKLVRLN